MQSFHSSFIMLIKYCGVGRARSYNLVVNSHLLYLLSYYPIFAVRTGLEPATTRVTVWHSKPTELPHYLLYSTIRGPFLISNDKFLSYDHRIKV